MVFAHWVSRALMIFYCKNLIARVHTVHLLHTYREANRCVGVLAKGGREQHSP